MPKINILIRPGVLHKLGLVIPLNFWLTIARTLRTIKYFVENFMFYFDVTHFLTPL